MPDGLTPQQRAAIETLDADVCVSAGAGSGKTRVLVQRFLRLATGDAVLGCWGVEVLGTGESMPTALPPPKADPAQSAPHPNTSTPQHLNTSPRAAVDEILAITFTRKAA